MVLQVCLKLVEQVTSEDSSLLKCNTVKTVQDWTPGLMVKALCTAEMSVIFHRLTQCNHPQKIRIFINTIPKISNFAYTSCQ
jgi:hypothetical protein